MPTDAVCIHESTHAAVALQLGLHVRRLQSGGWLRIPRYCAQLYPGLVRGLPVRSPVCLLEEDCLDTNPQAVLIAMAAPAYLPTGERKTDLYARMEALLASRYAKQVALDAGEIQFRASFLAEVLEPRIQEIAERLHEEGVIHDLKEVAVATQQA
jgi:hypothetical protein